MVRCPATSRELFNGAWKWMLQRLNGFPTFARGRGVLFAVVIMTGQRATLGSGIQPRPRPSLVVHK
jgi:hypothetical protein